jgi:hypothetical protein
MHALARAFVIYAFAIRLWKELCHALAKRNQPKQMHTPVRFIYIVTFVPPLFFTYLAVLCGQCYQQVLGSASPVCPVCGGRCDTDAEENDEVARQATFVQCHGAKPAMRMRAGV